MEPRDTDMGTRESSNYITFSNEELIKLFVSMILDLADYLIPVLLSPIIGDIADIIGLAAGLTMFGWMGFFAVLEFVPFADFIPIFSLIWVFWIYWRREKQKRDLRKFAEKWR